MTYISKYQLFTLMFIFEVGSTTLFALGIDAKQDAWIVILVALMLGIFIMYIFTELQKAYPNKNFVEIMTSILGNKLGMTMAFLYVWQTIWSNSRNLREFGEMILLTSLSRTPLIVVIGFFMILSIFTLLKGIEVLVRVSEILTPLLLIFLVMVFILVYLSGEINFENLRPVLGNGLKPIIKALPNVAMFPFGELYIFLMYYQFVNEKEEIRKIGMTVVIAAGILLAITLIVDISVLGDKYAAIAAIPFWEVIRLINIGEIITNLDAIATMIIFYGGFFKMTVYMYGNVLIISDLLKNKNHKLILILYGLFLLYFSIAFEPSFAYHRWMTNFDTNYFGIYFTHVFPTLMFLIYVVKRKRAQL